MGTGASKGKQRASSEKMEPKDKKILIKTLTGHTGGINCMDISSCNNLLLTGSDDRTARIWNLLTFDCKVVLEGHSGYISCCKIWQGQFALTGSFDRSVRKWNTVSGNCILQLEHHSGIVNRMLVYGEFLFTTSYDSTAVCWDLKNGEACRFFRGHAKSILPLAYVEGTDHDPQGVSDLEKNKDNLITGSMDKTARLWSIASSTSLKTFRGHKGAVLCLAVDMENMMLFTGSTDNTIRKWNLRTGGILRVFRGHEGSIVNLQMHHRLLYSASLDTTVRCWVAEFGDTTRIYIGHEHMVSDMKYYRGIVFTGSGDNNVRAFDSKSGTLKKTFKGHKFVVNSLMPYNDSILSASYDGSVKIWNVSELLQDGLGTSSEILSKGNASSRSLLRSARLRGCSPPPTDEQFNENSFRRNEQCKSIHSTANLVESVSVPSSREIVTVRESQIRRNARHQKRPRRGPVRVEPQENNRNENNNQPYDTKNSSGFLDFDYINHQLKDLLEGEDYWAESSNQSSLVNIKATTNGTVSEAADKVKLPDIHSEHYGKADYRETLRENPKLLIKRKSSDLLTKRPRTDSTMSVASQQETEEERDLSNEEIRITAMETSSNTSGYRTAETNSLTSSPSTYKMRVSRNNKQQYKSTVSFSPNVEKGTNKTRPLSRNLSRSSTRQTVETTGIRNKAKLKHQDSSGSLVSQENHLTKQERKQLELEILEMV